MIMREIEKETEGWEEREQRDRHIHRERERGRERHLISQYTAMITYVTL